LVFGSDEHAIEAAAFFVGGWHWLQAGLFELDMHFRTEPVGERNSVKRVNLGIQRRTEQLSVRPAGPETPESWLLGLA